MTPTKTIRNRRSVLKAAALSTVIALSFLMTCLPNAGAPVHAQSSCFLMCQRSYRECVEQQQFGCEIDFDNCIESCL